MEAEAQAETEAEQKVATYLESEKTRKYTYSKSLADYGNMVLANGDVDEAYEWDFIPTDGSDIHIYGKRFKSQEGVVCVLKSPNGKVYVRAIRTSYDSPVDTGAIKTICDQLDNTIDEEKGLLIHGTENKTKGGIILP